MLTVILSASGDASALARLLTALVPAAAEHVLADVVVLGAAGASREIADDAGATFADRFAEGLGLARGDWIAGLPLAATLAPGWIEALGRHMALTPPTPARLTTNGGVFSRRRPEGWLVPKALAASAGTVEQDLHRLARGRGGGRLRILASR
jgi:hypothetical protein